MQCNACMYVCLFVCKNKKKTINKINEWGYTVKQTQLEGPCCRSKPWSQLVQDFPSAPGAGGRSRGVLGPSGCLTLAMSASPVFQGFSRQIHRKIWGNGFFNGNTCLSLSCKAQNNFCRSC